MAADDRVSWQQVAAALELEAIEAAWAAPSSEFRLSERIVAEAIRLAGGGQADGDGDGDGGVGER